MSMMSINKRGFSILFTALFLCLSVVSAVHADTSAQGSYGSNYDCNGGLNSSTQFVPLACYSGSQQFSNAFNAGSLPQYLNDVFNIVISIGGILAVLRIAYAGYLYMGSADMWSNVQRAKEVLSDAIIGLLLLFAIYLILNQIDPNLLNLGVLNDVQKLPTQSIQVSPNTAPGSAI